MACFVFVFEALFDSSFLRSSIVLSEIACYRGAGHELVQVGGR